MGYLLTTSCYIIAFSPAFAIFNGFIRDDPMRIILFVLGAFFWLVSLLISSFIWTIMSPLVPTIYVSLTICIIFQELARVAYFILLKKAQRGLNKITRPGDVSVAPGVSDLHNARHMLALVCGLGMGAMAALFLTMNAFAAFSGPATLGLPEALEKSRVAVHGAGKLQPLYYALSALMLSLLHITWTIMVWDTCHRIERSTGNFIPAAAALVSHFAVSLLSLANGRGFHETVLVLQALILITCASYCNVIMGGTISAFFHEIAKAFLDAVTLSYIRKEIEIRRNAEEIRISEEPMQPRNTIET